MLPKSLQCLSLAPQVAVKVIDVDSDDAVYRAFVKEVELSAAFRQEEAGRGLRHQEGRRHCVPGWLAGSLAHTCIIERAAAPSAALDAPPRASRSARAIFGCRHCPHVVRLLGASLRRGAPACLIMELAAGGNLASRIYDPKKRRLEAMEASGNGRT